MSEVTVKQLANMVGIPVARLLAQLNEAGIQIGDENASVSETEKMRLLGYLRRSHGKNEATPGSVPSRITLKRKSVSELRQPVAAPRAVGARPVVSARPSNTARTVSVEVRRKRTYVKRSEVSEDTGKLQEAEAARQALAEQAEQQRHLEEETHSLRNAQEAHVRAEEEARRRVAEDARLKAEEEEEARHKAEEAEAATAS
jgi:translation initiation factor IF-2